MKVEKEKTVLSRNIENLNRNIDTLKRNLADLQSSNNDDSIEMILPSQMSENSVMQSKKIKQTKFDLEEDGYDDPMFISKRHERSLRALERQIDNENPGLKMNFLNMISAWAEFKME